MVRREEFINTDRKNNDKAKCEIEEDLRNYPYWLIAIETPVVFYSTRNDSTKEKNVIEDLTKRRKVEIITKVLDRLDNKSKIIIEKWYFKDSSTREQLLSELEIDKNKFYYLKNRALDKFMIALEYI